MLELGLILLVGLGAIATGVIVYKIVKVTIRKIKEYRIKKESKVLLCNAEKIMETAPRISMEALAQLEENPNTMWMAEVSETGSTIYQNDFAQDMEPVVENLLRQNDGAIVLE